MDDSNKEAVDSAADRIARVALTLLAEPGNRAVWSLVQSHGAPAALERLLGGDVPDDALRASVLAKTAGSDPRRQAEASLEQAQRIGARLVVPSDPEWPERVDDLAVLETDTPSRSSQNIRPPLCLWVLGFWPVGETLQRSVAVVGARAATPYGQTVATNIAYGLANHDWTVVAGGSFGIEAAAHRAALAADVRTVAVLACGVDRPYPAGNATLFEQITETGLLISAWPPGSDPLKHRFEFSHRLISAATAGTVLVEAAERTSATQMMHDVLALRRAAMVVPGPVDSAMSAGCHELLRTHPDIRLVTGVPHVLEELDTRSEQDA